MRAKKARRVAKTGRVKRAKKGVWAARAAALWSRRATSAWPIALILLMIVTAAMLTVGPNRSQSAESTTARSQPKSVVTTDEQSMSQSAAPAAANETVEKAAAPETAPVAITGCLERSQDAFRLRDTSGADAPRARSWKTGFLRKSAASIDVIDAANRVKLASHIGERVTVRGVLVDREMQVRSLQRVADSCGGKTKV